MLKTEKDLQTFTGIHTFKLLEAITESVAEVDPNTCKLLTSEGKIILVMTKLKTSLPFAALAILFQLSPTTCWTIFYNTLEVMARVLQCAVTWPSKENIMLNMPKCFTKYYSTRVVLDCTKVQIEKTQCLNCRILTYSHYYGCHTMKFMLGVFCSKVY